MLRFVVNLLYDMLLHNKSTTDRSRVELGSIIRVVVETGRKMIDCVRVHWTTTVSIGARPKVRRRLRSRKMALWRDLIPRLHRADDYSDSRLHLLDDFDNETTFEESGTRLAPPPPPSDDWERSPPSTVSTTKPTVDVSTSPAGLSAGGLSSSTPAGTVAVASSPPATDSGELAASSSNDEDPNSDHSTLFKTAAVGSALLALNVIVFTAVMCQWRGLRRTRLIELQKYASGVANSGDGIVLGVPCPTAAAAPADDAGTERVVATCTAPASPEARYELATPSRSLAAAAVLTSAECTCNNILQDGGSPGILLNAAPNNYYTITNHVATATAAAVDYANQRTTSTV